MKASEAARKKRERINFQQYVPEHEQQWMKLMQFTEFDYDKADRLAELTYDKFARIEWTKIADANAKHDFAELNKPHG